MLFSNSSASAESSVMIESGKTVKMHMTMLQDGQVLQTTVGGEPIEFVVGQDPILPGVEIAVMGLKAGEQKKFPLASADAFGEHDPAGVFEVPRENLPEGDIEIGMALETIGQDGRPLRGIVSSVASENVMIDFNHPLAGKDLEFEVEIIEVS